MPESRRCPKCTGSMDPGFVADYGLAVVQSAWYPGTAEKRRLPAGRVKGIKSKCLDASTRREIISFRCRNCGFLEHYA